MIVKKNEPVPENCGYCDRILTHTDKKKPKKYCDDSCRQKYWQQNKRKPEVVTIPHEEWEAVKLELIQLRLFRQHFELPINENLTKLATQDVEDIPLRFLYETGIDYAIRKADLKEKNLSSFP